MKALFLHQDSVLATQSQTEPQDSLKENLRQIARASTRYVWIWRTHASTRHVQIWGRTHHRPGRCINAIFSGGLAMSGRRWRSSCWIPSDAAIEHHLTPLTKDL